jgi:CHAT domain-containing protein
MVTERERRPAGCLDTAAIAAYIDGDLPEGLSRPSIDAHLADCEDCYELFAEAIRLTLALHPPSAAPAAADAPRLPVMRGVRRRAVLLAGGALAAAAALSLVLAPPAALERWWDPSSRPELREVVAAVGPRRAIEPRLTGGFAWASPPSAMRGTADSPGEVPDVQIAVARLAQRASADRSARTLSALGTAYLAAGQVPRAVEALEESVALSDAVAFTWSDLAAAYLARSTLPGQAADVPRALDAVERALALEPGLPEGHFNRALALERLGLVQPAMDAWQHYLAIDADSPWATEARERLADLERRQARRGDDDGQALRERLFDEILPAWTPQPASRAQASIDPPDAVRTVADALARLSADRFAADIVAAATREAHAARAADGHRAYGRARAHYRQDAMDAAGPAFDEAAAHLEAAGSPLALSARLYRALVAYRTVDLASAEHRLTSLLADLPAVYPSLAGRVKWTLGLVATRRGDFLEAARLYRAALSDFEQADEPDNAAFVRLLLAENEERRGEPLRAWEHRLAALGGTPREGALLQSAQSALRVNWPYTAAILQDEAARIARSQGRVTTLVDALRLRAVTYASIERNDEARHLVRDARAILADAADSSRERLLAEVDLAEAQAATTSDAETGIEAATRAARYFAGAGGTGRLPEVHLLRGGLRRLTGDLAGARDDLTAALSQLEAQRDRLPAGTERLAFGEIAKRAADELVEVEIAAGRPEAAIAAADRVRGWDLTGGASAALDLEDVRRRLDRETTILYYTVGPTRSHLWTIRAEGVTWHVVPASRAQLRRLVGVIREDRLDSSSMRTLHDLLVAPAAEAIAQGSRTIVVADGPLHALPFPALPGARSPYLIEEQALLLMPALGALAPRIDVPAGAAPRAVLAVGNPRLDPRVFPDLPDLPNAAVEARRVASLYDRSHLLLEDEATTEALLGALDGVDVLHFAGHAVVNDLTPDDSRLGLLNRQSRALSAGEIGRLTLPHLSLAVLAACRTLGPVTDRTQGPMNLARAFLQAGAGYVVANRWLVDDRAAAAFLDLFHERYRTSRDAAASLQQAQRALVASTDERLRDPAAWAGWVVIGRPDAAGARRSTRAHQQEKP